MRAVSLDQPARLAWSILSLLASLILAGEIPLRLTFQTSMSAGVVWWEVGLSVILLVETYLHLHTTYSERGVVVDDVAKIRRRYTHTWLLPDLLSALPFELMFGAALPGLLPVFRLLRLSRLLRIGGRGSFLHWATRTPVWNPMWGRLLLSVVGVSVLTHWIACGWLSLAPPEPLILSVSVYVDALYWAVTTLSTVGFGDIVPITPIQKLFGMAVMLLGVGLYGYVIGNAASIFSKLDAARMLHQERLDQIISFLTYKQVPPPLVRQARDHFHFMWENRMGMDRSHALELLPEQLHSEIMLFINREILQKVPVFEKAPPALLSAVANRLQSRISREGELIIREGELGNRMFFLSRGQVQVDVDGNHVANLGEGSFFGEAALLEATRRNASVRATELCELYTLDHDDFTEVLVHFPEFADDIIATARERSSLA